MENTSALLKFLSYVIFAYKASFNQLLLFFLSGRKDVAQNIYFDI